MADEHFDLVDENNIPTGKQALRSVAHATGLWHRTVHIYVFRETNGEIEFLVHLRSAHKDLHPNCWDTRFGGHIKSGETVEEGVISEMKEELGIDISLSDLIEGGWEKSNTYPNCEFSKVYYLGYDKPTESLSFNDGEVQRIQWLLKGGVLHSMLKDPQKWSGSKEGFEAVSQFLEKKLAQSGAINKPLL